MRELLVATASGAGVVRTQDGSVLLLADVTAPDGWPLRQGADTDRALVPDGPQSCVVGGLLPPGAVSAEAVDDRGARIAAAVGNGAYVVVLDQPSDGAEPIVCCRDRDGHPVSRPPAAGHPGVPVEDADVVCPACRAIDFEEYLPFEAGSSGETDSAGRIVPRPVVRCRVCGHQEQEPIVVRAPGRPDRPQSALTREQVMAKADAMRRELMWRSIEKGVSTQGFPIYVAAGWPARVTQSGSEDDGRLTSVTVAHFKAHGVKDSVTWIQPALTISTERDDPQFAGPLDRARLALRHVARPDLSRGRRPAASDAASALRHRARSRRDQAAALNAVQSERAIDIDGQSVAAFTLTGATGGWAVVASHNDLVITVAGHEIDSDSVRLVMVADPVTTFGPPFPRA